MAPKGWPNLAGMEQKDYWYPEVKTTVSDNTPENLSGCRMKDAVNELLSPSHRAGWNAELMSVEKLYDSTSIELSKMTLELLKSVVASSK